MGASHVSSRAARARQRREQQKADALRRRPRDDEPVSCPRCTPVDGRHGPECPLAGLPLTPPE